MASEVERPLAVRCGAFGDMVLLTALIRVLHAEFGHAGGHRDLGIRGASRCCADSREWARSSACAAARRRTG